MKFCDSDFEGYEKLVLYDLSLLFRVSRQDKLKVLKRKTHYSLSNESFSFNEKILFIHEVSNESTLRLQKCNIFPYNICKQLIYILSFLIN